MPVGYAKHKIAVRGCHGNLLPEGIKIMLKAIARKLVPSATVLALPAVCCGQAYARALVTPSSPPPSFIVQGVNTAGTVRVNNYANLEYLLNVAASVVEIGGIAWGLLCIYQGIKDPARRRGRIVLGLFLIAVGLSTPGLVNYITASGDCGGLF